MCRPFFLSYHPTLLQAIRTYVVPASLQDTHDISKVKQQDPGGARDGKKDRALILSGPGGSQGERVSTQCSNLFCPSTMCSRLGLRCPSPWGGLDAPVLLSTLPAPLSVVRGCVYVLVLSLSLAYRPPPGDMDRRRV